MSTRVAGLLSVPLGDDQSLIPGEGAVQASRPAARIAELRVVPAPEGLSDDHGVTFFAAGFELSIRADGARDGTLHVLIGEDHPLATARWILLQVDGIWTRHVLDDDPATPVLLDAPVQLDGDGRWQGTVHLGAELGTRGLYRQTRVSGSLVDFKMIPPLAAHQLLLIQGAKAPRTRVLDRDSDAFWRRVKGKKLVLLLHGTGMGIRDSLDHADDPAFLKFLQDRYAAVLGFNHPTVFQGVEANVRALLERIPRRAGITLDIVSVSRGGLVARQLIERAEYDSDRLRVERAVFVASPLMGTPTSLGRNGNLATKLRGLFHDGSTPGRRKAVSGRAPAAEWRPAQGGVLPKPGAVDQNPGGLLLNRLNRQASAAQLQRHPELRYFAMTSDYQPPDPAAPKARRRAQLRRHRERIATLYTMPGTQRLAANDTIVPTHSALGLGEHEDAPITPAGALRERNLLPIPDARARVFEPADDVTHLGYLASAKARRQIEAWLRDG